MITRHFPFLIVALMVMISSCTIFDKDDDKSADSMALVTSLSENADSFDTEVGVKFKVTKTEIPSTYESVPGNRAVIYFHSYDEKVRADGTMNIHLFAIEDILTKDVVTVDSGQAVEYADDVINVTGVSLTGDYLNLECSVASDGVTNHTIDLLFNKDDQTSDKKNILELRHNSNGDENGMYITFVVCFKIADFKPSVSGKKVTLRINTSEGHQDYDISEAK